MLDPQKQLRKAIIDALTDKINKPIKLDGYRPLRWNEVNIAWGDANQKYADQVKIYNNVPDDATTPYVKVYSTGYTEIDFNRDLYNLESNINIEAVSSFQGGVGGELEVNDIVSGIIKIIRKREPNYFDLSANGFNIYSTVINKVNYLEVDDRDSTYYKAIIDVSFKLQQN